jgi:type I restriction-modification system DNA methylase subunit
LKLGQTSFGVLRHFLDIDFAQANDFAPLYWHKPHNLRQARPDSLIVQGRSCIAIVEHKSPSTAGIDRRVNLEQLHTYMLISKAKLGILTDGISTLWVHNTDPRRKFDIKIITENGLFCSRSFEDRHLEEIIQKLNHLTDEVSQPPAFDPSILARSIWQDVYIATRDDPEKCFQTFVELFMYKLISDYNLLPTNLMLKSLTVENGVFKNYHGITQIESYFNTVRPAVKNNLFPPMNTDKTLNGLARINGQYITTKSIIPSLDSIRGQTSIIDGHAFKKQPIDYNSTFVRILKKLESLPHITSLEPGFKSRVYEQFLRRDPNASKVSGKYFTPRNVVKAIVQMADVAHLHADAVVCDPAAGVGGFITESLLELERVGIANYREVANGKILVERKFIGLEVLEDVVCLAKANLLLHCIENYSNFSMTAKQNFTELLADTFVYCHEDVTLGSLKHPYSEIFDLVMTNPPYIVSGTQNVTTKLREAGLLINYQAGGSGLESRFVNWIVQSLKRGGKAFIVLPKSMLARVDRKFKSWLRKKCIIDALIYLPERTFYTTPNPTYIVALTKKQNDSVEQQEPIFCYYIRDIGETRDVERNPDRNDLVEMVHEFKLFIADKAGYRLTTNFCKIVDVSQITPDKRWDIDYLWSPQQLADLGVIDVNIRPCESIITDLQELVEELAQAKAFIHGLVTRVTNYTSIALSDKYYFIIHRGKRITEQNCEDHPGDIPVVASGRHENSYLGTISEAYLEERSLHIFSSSDRIMTLGSTGAVGVVHMRREPKWFLHDDALAVEVINQELLPTYIRVALQQAINEARFDYTAKLYTERLKALSLQVPTDTNGSFDLAMQEQIALAYERQEQVEQQLRKFAMHMQGLSLTF